MSLNLCLFLLMNGMHLNFGLDSLNITAMPGETIKYNESVTFECVYTYGEDRGVVLFISANWTKNGETIGTIKMFKKPKPATIVTVQYHNNYVTTSLTLSTVNCSHIGNYSCAFLSLKGDRNRTLYKLKKHIFLDITAVQQKPTFSLEDGHMIYAENDVVSFTCLAVTGRPPVTPKMKITFTNGTTKPIQTTSTLSSTQDSCIKQERLKATIKLTRNHKAIVCSVTEELSSELPISFKCQSKKDQSKKAVRRKPTISSEDGRTLYTENDVVSFTCLAVTGRPPVSSKMKITFTNGTTKPIQTTSTITPMQDSCIRQERLKATIKLTRNHKSIVCSVTEELSSELPLSVNSTAKDTKKKDTKKKGQSKKDTKKKATVVAVTVGFLVVFLVGIVGGFLVYKYKRPKKQQNIEDVDKDDNENSSRISSCSSGEKGSRRKRSKRKKSRK